MSDLRIRAALANEPDVRAIFDLLQAMWSEGDMPPLDPMKALTEIHRVCDDEAAWMVEDAGLLVATCGIVEAALWFTDNGALVTRWLYAKPEHRGARSGGAFDLMLGEARALGAAVDMPVWLDVYNPAKARPGRLTSDFARFAFQPKGARMVLRPHMNGGA